MIIAQQRSKLISLLVASVVVLGAIVFSWLSPQPITNAADMSKFEAGNIMSDSVMSNRNSMTVQQIQAFLDSKNACNNTDIYKAAWYPTVSYSIKDGKFVCMAKESFNGESAAQIIWQAGQDYNINPQVLIVLLEKEQGLITDTWPNSRQYQTATGYGCPDTAPCDAQYYGLKNQLRQAANLFRTVLNGGWSNYPVGNVYIQYNPSASCGGSVVNIKNRATSALYRYTPYQPNEATKNVNIGVTAPCGAYGNKNFWWLFTDWFGDTTSGIYIDITKASQDITSAALANSSTLGSATSNIVPEYDTEPRVWQSFNNGTIIWTERYGAKFIPINSTYPRWRITGGSLGTVGVPRSNPVKESTDGRVWQDFENGLIIYSNSTSGWEILSGPIGDKWRATGGSVGTMGKPTSSVQIDSNSQRWQLFEKGAIVRKNLNSPAFIVTGPIYNRWSQVNIGAPKDDTPTTNSDYKSQDFEDGVIIWSEATGAWEVMGGFHTYWKQLGGSTGQLGKPVGTRHIEDDGRRWQDFERGTVIWGEKTGMYTVVFGPTYNRWKQLGGSTGQLGKPVGEEYTESDGRRWQYFENGTVIWSEATGAWEVMGGFHTYWKQLGGSTGQLGKPVGEEYTESDGRRWQDFERGRLTWRDSSGWSVTPR